MDAVLFEKIDSVVKEFERDGELKGADMQSLGLNPDDYVDCQVYSRIKTNAENAIRKYINKTSIRHCERTE